MTVPTEVSASEELTVSVPGLVEVNIQPPQATRSDQRQLDDLRSDFGLRLQHLGVSDMADARLAAEKRAKLLRHSEAECQRRLKFPQKCRSKIPHYGGCGDQPASVICTSILGFWWPSSAIERRADSILLLKREVERALRDARETFLQPLIGELTPYLRLVFPGARPAVSDRFVVHELTRGEAPEPVGSLSGGTREQIAVLSRLAFGTLFAKRGKALPVILDEPLGHSDPERRDRMFDALHLAAQSCQVLVFACDDVNYAGLGGTRLSIMSLDQPI